MYKIKPSTVKGDPVKVQFEEKYGMNEMESKRIFKFAIKTILTFLPKRHLCSGNIGYKRTQFQRTNTVKYKLDWM